MDKWVDNGTSTSLQVRIAQANLDIAAQDVTKNRGGHLPTLDAVATYNDTAQGAGFQIGPGYDTSIRYIGVQLAVPLYQGGLVNSKVREALASQDKAKQDLENTKRTVALNTRTAIFGRDERNRADQGAGNRARLEPEFARLDQARAGSGRQNAGRRAQCHAAADQHAARSRAGDLRLRDQRAEAQGGGRHVDR